MLGLLGVRRISGLQVEAGSQVSLKAFAREYEEAAHAAATFSVDAEEEAQLTNPVSTLFSAVVREAGLGKLQLIRETRLDSTRPDFAALYSRGAKTQQKGFVELKAPSVPVDVTHWNGRNARQWLRLREEAEILIICNGIEAQLYQDGNPVGSPATLPYSNAASWQPDELVRRLGRFIELTPTPIVDVAALSLRLAVRTAAFQMAEVAVPRRLFSDILRLIAELRPLPVASVGE